MVMTGACLRDTNLTSTNLGFRVLVAADLREATIIPPVAPDKDDSSKNGSSRTKPIDAIRGNVTRLARRVPTTTPNVSKDSLE